MSDLADRFHFSIEGLSQKLRVVRFAGVEGISELFRVEVTFASADGAIEIEQALGHPGLFTLTGDDGERRFVHGVVSRFEQGESGSRFTLYHATLMPGVFRLLHRRSSRIFQELTTPAIVEKVLEGAGLSKKDLRASLHESYRPREYCVQYRESDWAFVCRLLEEEGICWFFEHDEEGHVLVLGDRPSAHEPIAGEAKVLFRASPGALSAGEHVHRIHYAGEVLPGRITLRDHDFQKPSQSFEGEASAGGDDDDLGIYEYPGANGAPQATAGLARIRLEEQRALHRVGEGGGSCSRFAAGRTFELCEHPRDSLNRQYLITRIDYEGFEPSMGELSAIADEVRYENRFQCTPVKIPFRPQRLTPKPSVRGVQTAVVVGPSGEEIHTDSFGRIKVQFYWDRQGKKDDKSSCWIRVSQAWAGEGWGAMNVPRVGQEVLVDFLDGDPDRPIVIGRVYHGTNVPPYGLPANKTRTTFKTSSTPGGEGFNELRFEDKKGSEEVYLHGQKDLVVEIEHDHKASVGNDRALRVTHDLREEVGHDRALSVDHEERTKIGDCRTISVGADHTEDIGGNLSLSVSKSRTDHVGEDAVATIGGKLSLEIGSSSEIKVSADLKLKVGGSAVEEIDLEKTLKAGSKVVIRCGSSTITVDKSGVKIEADGSVKLSGQQISVDAAAEMKLTSSGKVDIKASGPMQIDASGPVKLKGAVVGIN